MSKLLRKLAKVLAAVREGTSVRRALVVATSISQTLSETSRPHQRALLGLRVRRRLRSIPQRLNVFHLKSCSYVARRDASSC